MKASLFVVVLAVCALHVSWATESETLKSNIEKIDATIKDGKIDENYLAALYQEFAKEVQEETVSLKATTKTASVDTARDEMSSTQVHKPSEQTRKLSAQYNKQTDVWKKVYDHVQTKYGTSYDQFYGYVQKVQLPSNYCPTKSTQPCSDRDYRYRQTDGWCNNLEIPIGGAAGTPYQRILPYNYDSYCSTPRTYGPSGAYLPNARDVALKIYRHFETESTVSILWLFYGQFIDHDAVLTPTENKRCKCNDTADPKCFNIPVPPYDYYFKGQECLPLTRSSAAVSTDTSCGFKCREQLTEATHALDLSSLYGFEDSTSAAVRHGSCGKLAFTEYMNTIVPMFLNNTEEGRGCCGNRATQQCMVSGDDRAESNAFLFIVQLLFFYEHNRIADQLCVRYPSCSDEIIFEETRRILIALFQKITFNDWLPVAIGPKIMKKFDLLPEPKGRYFYGYDSTNFPSTYNEMVLGFRIGHTLIPDDLMLADEYCNKIEELTISDCLFISNSIVCQNQIDGFARGAVCQHTYYKFDQMASDLTDHLFEKFFGASSLSARNIQRGRDHGLGTYQDMRRHFKLSVTHDFYKLYGMRSETKKKLAELYADPDDIDFYVGITAERSYKNYDPEGGLFGETLSNFFGQQFRRFKYNDRFFWESGNKLSNPFTIEQLDNIRSVNIGSLVCQHINIRQLQKNPFLMPGYNNRILSCDKFASIDVDLFKIDGACQQPYPFGSGYKNGYSNVYKQ